MAETDLSKKLMPALHKVFHAERIENVSGNGTPDINYAGQRAQGWIETKVAKGALVYFERFQLPWIQKRLRATKGRFVWLVVENAKRVALYPASRALEAKREIKGDWTTIRQEDLGEPAWSYDLDRRIFWQGLIEILANE